MNARALLVLAALAVACNEPRPEQYSKTPRRREVKAEDRTDASLPMDVRVDFVPPASWERVQLSNGVEFRQPAGFTIVNAPSVSCHADTPPADVPILRTEIAERWPLTLAMRRGDLADIARANGFTIDSTDIAAHGQHPGDTTVVRRGEGWMLLSGRSGTPVLLASVRAQDCYLLWAARGMTINVDTLALVLRTVQVAPISP
jgi:hypothetical protein